jgi:hypothetical protein
MAARKDVHDFFELRAGFLGMSEFATAALEFLDKNGIALHGTRTNGRPRTYKKRATPADGVALREKVKQHFQERRPALKGAAKIREQRQVSANILAKLDMDEPRQLSADDQRRMGSLVRRGYVEAIGDGYVRTSKPFLVEKPHARTNGAAPAGDANDTFTITQAAAMMNMSGANLRILIARKKVKSRKEKIARTAGQVPVKTMVVRRSEVDRYLAAQKD